MSVFPYLYYLQIKSCLQCIRTVRTAKAPIPSNTACTTLIHIKLRTETRRKNCTLKVYLIAEEIMTIDRSKKFHLLPMDLDWTTTKLLLLFAFTAQDQNWRRRRRRRRQWHWQWRRTPLRSPPPSSAAAATALASDNLRTTTVDL